jgi:TolB-like protein
VLLVVVAGLWLLARMRSPAVAQSPPPTTATVAAGAGTSAPVSIAVLPFVNRSSDPEQEYFSDGLSEELLNQLAQVPDLRVIGRTSSFAFKGKNEDLRHIGEVLGVNHLLEGSVRKAGNRVLITARLIRQSDGSQLWSETYERSLNDIFAIQEEIARTVAGQLRLKLGAQNSNAAGTTNVAAFDEFLEGRALLNSYLPDSLAESSRHLERAVALDPTYIPARLWLIDAYDRQALQMDPGIRARWIGKQEEVISQLVKLAPDSAEASLALAYRDSRTRHLSEMERHLRAALPLSGSLGMLARQNYYGFLFGTTQFDIARSEIEKVRQEDPLNVFLRTNLLLFYENAGEFERADIETRQLLQIPGGKSSAMLGTAVTRAQGQRDDAKVRQTVADLLLAYASTTSIEALMQPLLGDKEKARQKLRQIASESRPDEGIYFPGSIAQWAAYLGDRELALGALTRLVEPPYGFNRIAFLWFRPVFRDLRGEPEFKAQLRKLGLVDYWRSTGNWGQFCKPVGNDDFECH